MKKYLLLFSLLVLSLPTLAHDKRSDMSSNLQKAPLFKDGKGYYSYKTPLQIPLPKGKVLIQYFYRYGCEICLNADDYLKHYAKRNADKVVLQRNPSFEKGHLFTAQMNAAFVVFGRPDLSDKYLFDSADKKKSTDFIENNAVIKRWLEQNAIPIDQFHRVFASEQVKEYVERDRKLYQIYSPPITPIAILNGKYILIRNTLYNDDYTYAVLDFLVEKLQQEEQFTQENKK